MGLIVDNFAGGGGASTGIEAALGCAVDYAINHDEQAIRMHEVNHPGTVHVRNNIWQIDPRDIAQGRPVDLAWFSPDCKHFSKAKGGKPREKSIRDLAWVVVLWAKRVKPALILLENVEEFRTWGPLCDEGKPIKERQGETFDQWCGELRKAGYKLQFRELRACDYGAQSNPQAVSSKAGIPSARQSDIVDQLRGRTFGKGALEERAASEIIRLRRAYRRSRRDVERWNALMHVLPAGEAIRLLNLADAERERFAQAIDARRAATGTGAVADESAVGNADAPEPFVQPPTTNTQEGEG